MNFNYDLMTWVDYFIGAFICCFGMVIGGQIVTDVKLVDIKKYKFLLLIVLSIILIINSLIFDNIGKIIISLIVFISVIKYIFNQNYTNSLLYGTIIYVNYILAEATVSFFIVLSSSIIVFNDFIKTIFINIIIVLISILYLYLMKNKIKKYINEINKNYITNIILLFIITIIILASSLYDLYINKWIIDYSFILNIIIFIGCLFLTIFLLKQYLKNKELADKYILLNDYMKTSAELIEKYSTTIHKYKNNLIAIKGYLNEDMKEAEKYIDNLIGIYNNKKYNWFSKINNIQIDAIRYLIYYKLSKAEMDNLVIAVNVSNDVKKIKNNLVTVKEANILLEIIGEFFDNAIYASNESEKKELNIIIYEENKWLKFIISNTYKGVIDLSMINKNGYTTKGNNHGLGLYDVEKTINKNRWINIKYELLDEYFVVNLSIKFDKINK